MRSFQAMVLSVILATLAASCIVGAPSRNAGERCSEHIDCVSISCQGGICCDTRCADICTACSAALTGLADGQCAPVIAGRDPDEECADSMVCDGAGACRAPVGGSCTADSDCPTQFCRDGVCCSEGCDGVCFACSEARTGVEDGLCRIARAGTARPGECQGEAACDGTGQCFAKQALDACAADYECVSGSCREGICCASDCSNPCFSCTFATTGMADGQCAPVLDLQDPFDQCPGGTACNGAGACHTSPPGIACNDPGECASGFCADGVCCNVNCNMTCVSCVAAETGDVDGVCAALPLATETADECIGAPVCDGAAHCVLEIERISCSSNAQCSSDVCCGDVCRGGWVSVGPNLGSGTLRAIWAASAKEVYVVGDAALIRVYDGDVWQTVELSDIAGRNLTAVDGALDAAVVVGDAGTVVLHDGDTWTTLPTPTAVTLRTVAVVSASEIYVAGVSSIYRWNGTTWSAIADSTDDWRALWRRGNNVFAGSGSGALVTIQGTALAHYSWPGGRQAAPAPIDILDGAALPGNDHIVITDNGAGQRIVQRTNGVTNIGELSNATYAGLSTAGVIRYAIETTGEIWRFDGTWASRTPGSTGFIDVVSPDGCTAFALLSRDVLKY